MVSFRMYASVSATIMALPREVAMVSRVVALLVMMLLPFFGVPGPWITVSSSASRTNEPPPPLRPPAGLPVSRLNNSGATRPWGSTSLCPEARMAPSIV